MMNPSITAAAVSWTRQIHEGSATRDAKNVSCFAGAPSAGCQNTGEYAAYCDRFNADSSIMLATSADKALRKPTLPPCCVSERTSFHGRPGAEPPWNHPVGIRATVPPGRSVAVRGYLAVGSPST